MKPSQIILAAFLPVAVFCCCLSVISFQQSRIHVVNVPGVSPRSALVPNGTVQTGILSDPNFQKVLQALERRTGTKTLAEPEVTTIRYGTINHIDYGQTFTLPMTNS